MNRFRTPLTKSMTCDTIQSYVRKTTHSRDIRGNYVQSMKLEQGAFNRPNVRKSAPLEAARQSRSLVPWVVERNTT